MLSKVQISELKKFKSLIYEGISKWMEAGQIVADILNKDPDALEFIVEKTGVPVNIIRKFEAIGNKRVYPKLLVTDSPGIRKLVKCSYKTQEYYYDNPIDVIVKKQDGIDLLKVKVENLTYDQCKLVFDKDHIRTIPEQRAYMESLNLSEGKPVTNLPYIIKNRKLIIKEAGLVFTPATLKKIIKELES